MYAFESMIDLGLKNAGFKKWKSDWHRVVAVNMCIGNPAVKNMDTLIENVKLIQAVPNDKIRKLTVMEAIKMGIVL